MSNKPKPTLPNTEARIPATMAEVRSVLSGRPSPQAQVYFGIRAATSGGWQVSRLEEGIETDIGAPETLPVALGQLRRAMIELCTESLNRAR